MAKKKRYLTVEQRRAALKLAYSDKEWVDSIDNMPNKQVCAIFDNLRKDEIINFDGYGNIFFKTREEVKELKKRRKEARIGHQMTFDDWAKQQEEKRIEIERNNKILKKEYNKNGQIE